MASRNERKIYIKSGIYHVYNRGVNKLDIFSDEGDYRYFTESFPLYLLTKEELLTYLQHENYSARKMVRLLSKVEKLKNYASEIDLLAYCLMPNHFHLLLRQNSEDGMSKFLKSLQGRYSKANALKHNRIGPLFQSRFKAVLVGNLNYFRTVISYIHNNPSSHLGGSQNPAEYSWSSFQDYIGSKPRSWIKTRYE
jgi:putative transposase